VLFTSGYTEGDIQRRGLLTGGAAFLQKPVTPEALVKAVAEMLNGTGQRVSVADQGNGR
jgi:FixJ family two-component response regulator